MMRSINTEDPNTPISMEDHSIAWWRPLLARWWVVALMGLFVLLLDLVLDHYRSDQAALSILYEGDILALLLISAGFVLGLYLQKNAYEKSALKRLSLQHELSVGLASARDFDDIIAVVSGFFATFLNLTASALYVPNRDQNSLHKVSQWVSDQYPAPDFLMSNSVTHCETCEQIQTVNGQIPTCSAPKSSDARQTDLTHYCLPLQIEEQLIGLLRISIDQNRTINAVQSGQILTLIPVLAVVVQSAVLRQTAFYQSVTTAKESERRSLTHDLHDTLGQNLSYLRLKLDQMTRAGSHIQPVKFRKDLDHMLMVAAESCELVQETLVILDPDETPPMGNILREYCELVGERSNLAIEFNRQGEPIYLSQQFARHVFYLFREALSNIEKHAGATKVIVSMVWTEQDMEIRISDNGSGFDPQASPPDGHYGLKSMHQRVEDLNGKMTITSMPDAGTTLLFSLPVRSLSEDEFV